MYLLMNILTAITDTKLSMKHDEWYNENPIKDKDRKKKKRKQKQGLFLLGRVDIYITLHRSTDDVAEVRIFPEVDMSPS